MPDLQDLCNTAPAIDGFRISDCLYEYDAIAQMRLDAMELSEVGATITVENAVSEQGRVLKQYRFKLQSKRRELVRERILAVAEEIDRQLPALGQAVMGHPTNTYVREVDQAKWSKVQEMFSELDVLLGGTERPARWSALNRHLSFGMVADLQDIQRLDWPSVKAGIQANLYGEFDAIPVEVIDLADVVAAKPQGPVPTKLDWSTLSDEEFERLIFALISDAPGYENPKWLQHTRAPDRGRDLSVTSVENDSLAGLRTYRVVIQCKHWLSKSVALSDVANVRAQMELQTPRVDRLVIATTGRFTNDAVQFVENHNQSNNALRIELWADSDLERLLAARPHLIGHFMLKRVAVLS